MTSIDGAETGLPDRALRLEFILGDDKIASALLGLIERTVAALDEILHRLAGLKLADADRHGDARQCLAGGAAGNGALGKRTTDTFGRRRAGGKVRTGKNGDELLAAITGRKIVLAKAFAQGLRHQAQHLVADAVAEIVVEALEVVDVDQERAERLVVFHGLRLRGAEEFLQRAAVG